MLNQLVESKNHMQENARKNGFLFVTLGVLTAVLMSGWTYSLFAKNFGLGAGEIGLSSIVAPVVLDEAPPPKTPEMKPPKSQSSAPPDKIVLKNLYSDVETTKVPPKDLIGEKDVVSATKFDLKNVQLGDMNQIPGDPTGRTGTIDPNACGFCSNSEENKTSKKEEEKEPEVVVKPTPQPTPKKEIVQSLGVINGRATYLAQPPFPPPAKAIGLSGTVNVQVTIDEKGSVVSASVVSGHPLLRAAALGAARQSRFSPTYLSNQPVKVTGVIVYQFKAN